MRSNNPVFARSEEFNGRGTPTYPGSAGYDGFGQEASPYGVETPGAERMTIDSVVQKTGISLLLLLVTAAATWWWIGDMFATPTQVDSDALARASLLAMLGAGIAFALSLVNSFKKVISPALVLAFAAAEGVALGAISKFFDAQFGDGIITQAVFGTFAAFAGTLAAYKFLNIQVSDKFRKMTIAGMFGMVGLGLMSLVLSFFGIQTGLFGFGTLGLVMSIIGLTLGVFMLILDFDFVEKGVAAGLPERESWRAAFGLTVSLVWIYTNLLRILAILRGD